MTKEIRNPNNHKSGAFLAQVLDFVIRASFGFRHSSLVTQYPERWRQLFKTRLEILLIIAPPSHGGFENRLGHFCVGWRADGPGPRMFVEAQHPLVPTNSQKIERAAGAGLEVFDQVFIANLDGGVAQAILQRLPHLVGQDVVFDRLFQAQPRHNAFAGPGPRPTHKMRSREPRRRSRAWPRPPAASFRPPPTARFRDKPWRA